MIVAIDDDDAALELIAAVLGEDGHEVYTFGDAPAALAFLDTVTPDLVISDVLMPGMTGFDLRRALLEQRPEADTPFVFLSSLDEPEQVVLGLELGAADYLVKPVNAAVLRAKVRALLRRTARDDAPAYVGRLEDFPFARIVQLCELRGITGEVEFRADGIVAALPFDRGALAADVDVELVDRLSTLGAGTFTIRVASPGLADAGLTSTGGAARGGAPAPLVAGRVSCVHAGGHAFQVLSEYLPQPHDQVVTIVAVDGRTAWKRAGAAGVGADREALGRLVAAQHAEVEADVARSVAGARAATASAAAGAAPAPQPAAEPPRHADPAAAAARFQRLFDEGVEASMRGDHAAALAAWEAAQALDPDNRTLDVNLAIVRRKLGASVAG